MIKSIKKIYCISIIGFLGQVSIQKFSSALLARRPNAVGTYGTFEKYISLHNYNMRQ